MKYKGLIVAVVGHGTTTITKELADLLTQQNVDVLLSYDSKEKLVDEPIRLIPPLKLNEIIIRDDQPNKYFHKPRNNFNKK